MSDKKKYEKLLHKLKKLEKENKRLKDPGDKSDLFRRFADATSQGLGMANFKGEIIYVNPKLARLHDTTAQISRIGRTFFESYPPDLREKLKKEILPQVRSKGSWIGELVLLTEKGKLIPTIENFFVVPDKDGEPQYFGDIITDISEQKKILSLLKESEERYRIITEQTGQMLYDCDYETGHIYWAGNIKDITGFSSFEFRNFTLDDLKSRIHPKDVERYEKALKKAKVDYGKHNLEYRFKRKDDSFIHIEDQGIFLRHEKDGPIKMLGAIKDITQRKEHEAALTQANALLESKVRQRTIKLAIANEDLKKEIELRLKVEKDLRESENRYRIVTNHAGDGIAVFQDTKLVFANKSFARLFEYENTESLLGKDAKNLLPKALQKEFVDFLITLQTGKETSKLHRGRGITLLGKEKWIEGIHTLIQWEGKPAVLATLRDVTDSVEREIKTRQEANELRQQNIKLASTIRDRYKFGDLVGKSPEMQELYEQILSACATDASVVIYGESGTGKELTAKAIHDFSFRAKHAFVPVNCGAIPEYLMESEFFGHKKGAFTGADRDKKGYLDYADKGTLFLDEVGEISPSVQVKLLRAIDGNGHTPLGSSQVRKSNFRVVSATNQPLVTLVEKGKIREDFYYRTHIVPIYMPALRNRKEDIPLLVDHFIKILQPSEVTPTLPGNIMDSFMEYSWPGNVRELLNVLQRYLTVGRLEFSSGWGIEQSKENKQKDLNQASFKQRIEEYEKKIISAALKQTKYNRSKAADLLSLPRRTLFNKMQKYGL